MRIISGSARGRQLTTFAGKEIRPTPDRVREAMFSILTSKLGSFNGLKVLELYAGSGAQALESLSRGAKNAVLIDSGEISSQVINTNIKLCKFESSAQFIKQDVLSALSQLSHLSPFDLILLDPPYNQQLIPKTLKQIEHLNLLAENGILCAESAKNETLEDVGTLKVIENRSYGSTRIHLYQLQELI